MVCNSVLDSKVIGKRHVKFPFDIRELPHKLTYQRITVQTGKTASLQAYLAS